VLLYCCIAFIPRGARAKMSLFSYNPANQLSDDVLLVIFDQLDEDDFLRCEVVCRRWRNFLLSQTPWRRLFHRKIVSSEKWRQLWRSFGVDETKLPSGHYRGLCRALIHEMNEADRNWRNGNFRTTFNSYDSSLSSNVSIGNDWIVCHSYNYLEREDTLEFFDQCSPEVKSSLCIPRGSSAVTNTEIVVVWDEKDIQILNTAGQLICEVPELDEYERISWKLKTCCIAGDQMAVFSRSQRQEKLSLWDVSNLPKVICLKSQLFNIHLQVDCLSSMEMKMKMDDQFIVLSTSQWATSSFVFFSKKTLVLHWEKTVKDELKHNFAYGKGMLLLLKKKKRKSRASQRIQMYDVTSGHCFRELPFTVGELPSCVCFNSKFMVVAPFKNAAKPKLYVYDLEALKDQKSNGLVRTLVVKNHMSSIILSETEIFCITSGSVCRLNFSPFGLFGKAAKSMALSSPWRSVWRSKGVDEEPLEPVRHMEVYMEVLKYFDELGGNCQAAIETYPASDLMADDMLLYIENMKRKSQKLYNNTVHISKTTRVTVIGKTVQFIDSTTERVVKEMALTSEAISLYFGQNLLVFVFENTNTEHVLSIWRVDNSLNLTHLEDVTIGDYDGFLQVDEQFITVKTGNQTSTEETYNFISMKTFQVERSLSSRAKHLQYDNGYLFSLKKENSVRILDVASGTFLRDIRIKRPEYYNLIYRANSKYVVIASHDFKLYVYDLKCLKETDAVSTHLPLTTIDLECKIEAMLMNETHIVSLCQNNTYVVDLKPIDRLRCPESC
jgi:F-box-like